MALKKMAEVANLLPEADTESSTKAVFFRLRIHN